MSAIAGIVKLITVNLSNLIDFVAIFAYTQMAFLFAFVSNKVGPFRSYKGRRNHYVLISGCSSGIGLETANYLASNGYSVFAGVRNDADGKRIKKEGIIPVILDVTKDDTINTCLRIVSNTLDEDKESKLVGIVNNAGISLLKPLELTEVKDYDRVFGVNVFGVTKLTTKFIPLLKKYQGRIIIVGSAAGLFVLPYATPYSMAKYAMEAFADGLRRELSIFRISVSIIEPGMIKTDIQNKVMSEVDEFLANKDVSKYQVQWFKTLIENITEVSALPPSCCATNIHHSLSAEYPLPRYAVGLDARLITIISAWPVHLQDLISGILA